MTTRAPSIHASSRRDLAVDRAMQPMQDRAERRAQRLIDVALDLVQEAEFGRSFTVQEITERSGLPLATFYAHFRSKSDLLLAVLEHCVSTVADNLRELLAGEADAQRRLRIFVAECSNLRRPASAPAAGATDRPVAEIACHLIVSRPVDTMRALDPLVTLCRDLLVAAEAAGVARGAAAGGRTAEIVVGAIMFDVVASALGGVQAEDPAECVWELLFAGLAATG